MLLMKRSYFILILSHPPHQTIRCQVRRAKNLGFEVWKIWDGLGSAIYDVIMNKVPLLPKLQFLCW